MASPTQAPGSGLMVPSVPINFSINIDGPENETDKPVVEHETREMPFDGVVKQMYIDIPNGVHSNAGFRVWDEERGRRVFPFNEETDWAAFNDVQEWWDISFPLREGEEIEVEYINQDHNTEGHLLKVWAVFVGIEALPYTLDEIAERNGVDL